MFDQLFDRATCGLMAAVLVVPEPATLVICALILAGALAQFADTAKEVMRARWTPAFAKVRTEGNPLAD
jgi:hypothetical protein